MRGYKKDGQFTHDDDGKPYNEVHYYFGANPNTVKYWPIPDRERGAQKRIAKIMANYPDFWSYVQGDARGAALYVGKKSEQERTTDRPLDLDGNYSRGIAIYK